MVNLFWANLTSIVWCFDLSGEFTHAGVLPRGIFWYFQTANFVKRALLSNKVLDENRKIIRPVYSVGLSQTLFFINPKKKCCVQSSVQKEITNKIIWVDLCPFYPTLFSWPSDSAWHEGQVIDPPCRCIPIILLCHILFPAVDSNVIFPLHYLDLDLNICKYNMSQMG